MNQKFIPGVVLAGGMAICAIGWLALPSLQTAQATVDQQAGVELERARRILHEYSHGLTFKSLLLDRLSEFEVDINLENADELLEEFADDYQQIHEARWASYQPYDFDGVDVDPRQARAKYGNLPSQARKGIQARQGLLQANDSGLADALDAVRKALDITAGDTTSRNHAEANRLKGVILAQQAATSRLQAMMLRRQALPLRRELATLGRIATAYAKAEGGTPDASGVAVLTERLGAANRVLEDKTAALAEVNRKIDDLESRLSAARGRADAARQAISDLTRRGIDFSRADGADAFQAAVSAQDSIFRAADAEARALEYGTLPNARIDDSGDYLTGKYVEAGSTAGLTVEPGLSHFRHDRAVLAREVELGRAAVDGFHADIERIEGLAEALKAEGQLKHRRASEARVRAGEAFTELNRLESEAFSVEDDALTFLDQAVRAFSQAAQGATEWVNAGSEASQGLGPDSRDRSADYMQSQSGWMTGHIKAQQADAQIQKAWILYTRFADQNRTAAALTAYAEPLGLNEADDEAEAAKAADAHDAAVEQVAQAVRLLERSHRDTGRHWTFVAQSAAINELMARLGHPEYTADAIEAYRAALANRAEDDPAARPFKVRLETLTSRK